MSTFSEIEPELLSQVTGGGGPMPSAGKVSNASSEKVMAALQELMAALGEVKARRAESRGKMMQMVMQMHEMRQGKGGGGKAEGGKTETA
jgi:hypothetical protein